MRIPDNRQRFLIESCDVRGQLVHLDQSWKEALARTDYPPRIRQVLGEAFVAATLLAGTIKFDGQMTLQIRGPGPVHLLVVQVTRDAKVRGLARWKGDTKDDSLKSLFGEDARMTITIEASRHAEPYQGIVPLEGERLTDAIRQYFRTSEQLLTDLWLAVSGDTIAGLLLQRLPGEERAGDDEDGWARAKMLASTVTSEELCLKSVPELLNRLYNEETVRLFDPEAVQFYCSCSRLRTDNMLIGLGSDEVQSILEEQGAVEITCEFCDSQYRYDAIDVAALFSVASPNAAANDPENGDPSNTVH